MILYRRRLLKKADLYFDEPERDFRVDVVRYIQRSSPLPGAQCYPFATRLIDLHSSVGEILAGMDAATRKNIRQAERKDAFLHSSSRDANSPLTKTVFDLQDEFAAGQGLPQTDRSYMRLLGVAGVLDVSLVRSAEGAPLAWRIYYRDGKRARALQGGSHFRGLAASDSQRLGRANRFDLWCDMVRFQNDNMELLDLGGWYTGDSDVQKMRINEFKRGFGGYVVTQFNCVRAASPLGALVLRLRHVEEAWRKRRAQPRPTAGTKEADSIS